LTTFTELGLAKPLLRALDAQGYTNPTPIQAQAIPTVMEGRDLLGIAQTGTGKTAAFALPILHRLAADPKPAPRRGCRCLVLSPTRELASQIAESFRSYGAHTRLSVAVVFGGAKINPQIKALANGVDVLVATPGRLLDHLGQHTAFLGETEIFVLDEADQMLDLGFIVPIRRIVQNFKKPRQNLFFSATMPTEIGKLAGELLKDPARVHVTPQATTVERINQSLIYIEADKKKELLAELFADPKFTRTIVFTRTKRGADRVAKHLEHAGISAASIHGDKSQPQRERALASFKRGDVRALVATDIAARGIDIDAVSHVVQYELPNVPEAYVHRIGRTARAGADGSAIAFCADDERNLLKDIQRTTRQTIPSFDRRRDPQLAVMAKASAAAERARPSAPEPTVNPRDVLASEQKRPRNRRRTPGAGAGAAGGASNYGGGAGGRDAPRRPQGAQPQGQRSQNGGGRNGGQGAVAKAAAPAAQRWHPLEP
jgi:ATP-dependent RNA helicase RhlE